MKHYFISACRSGLRGRSFHAVFILGLFLIAGAYLSALFSPRQPETVSLDVGFSGMRFAMILLALFWVQDLVGKEIERRTTTLYLAYPTARSSYILGRYTGILFLLLMASIIFGLLLWLAAMSSSEEYSQSHSGSLGPAYWSAVFGIWLSTAVIAAFALCIATLSTITALPLALGVAFAISANSLGSVIDYLATGAYGREDLVANYGPTLNAAHWILPDLSRLDWREWPMYAINPPENLVLASCLMAVCYACLMLGFAVLAFNNREFD